MDFIQISNEHIILDVESLRNTLIRPVTINILVTPEDDKVLISIDSDEAFYERQDTPSLLQELVRVSDRLEEEEVKEACSEINEERLEEEEVKEETFEINDRFEEEKVKEAVYKISEDRLEEKEKTDAVLGINDEEFQNFYRVTKDLISNKPNGVSMRDIKLESLQLNISNNKRQYFMRIMLRSKLLIKVKINETKMYFLTNQVNVSPFLKTPLQS